MMDMDTWSQRNKQLSRNLLDSVGKQRSDYRYCVHCGNYKPKNKAPHVKGWKCTDCTMVKK